jgi:hypothetical protein
LARHPGNIPAKGARTYPRNDARQMNASVNERREAIPHISEIFLDVLNYIARSAKRWEDIHKAKQLPFELFILYRNRHHPLVKAGLAEKRLGMSINELEDAHATLLDLALERPHFQN